MKSSTFFVLWDAMAIHSSFWLKMTTSKALLVMKPSLLSGPNFVSLNPTLMKGKLGVKTRDELNRDQKERHHQENMAFFEKKHNLQIIDLLIISGLCFGIIKKLISMNQQ